MYEIEARSVIGERPEQQDAIYTEIKSDRTVMILCDGMGGFNGGSIASNIAINELARLLDKEKDITDKHFLTYIMDLTDSKIASIKDENNMKIRAGTTCVLAIIVNNQLHWLSVGDSRMYIIRDNKITQMTRDHIVELEARIDFAEGRITYDEYLQSLSNKNTLCSYLGINGIKLYDINDVPLQLKEKDIIILASDGLFKSLNEEQIKTIVLESNGMKSAADKLIDRASAIAKGQNQDNTSFILCRINLRRD